MWLDGEMVRAADVRLPLMGHAPQRGSLVFDVGSFHAGPDGATLFRAREHVARFLRSAAAVGIEVPWSEDDLVQAAVEVVRASGHDEGLVRWSGAYAAEEPDLVPRSPTSTVAVAAQILEDPHRIAPLRVAVFDDARKASPDVLPPHVKAAASYLGPMLARRRALALGADDVVLLDVEGNVAEAPIANVFAVVNGALWTPPLRYVLPGITRDAVLAIANQSGLFVREEPLSRQAFEGAEEAFLTATSFFVSPISHVNGRALPDAPGPVTARLAAALEAAQRGDDRYAAWRTPVSTASPR
jgi:branched-chain amino acid aminotransferase